jgi:NO-binding membrane sensor protein with MHYT domain
MLLLLSVAVACLALGYAVLLARHVRELERVQAQIDLRLARLEGDFAELRQAGLL